MQRRVLALALPLLTLSWLFPPWTSYTQSQGMKEKARPLGLSFVLAPPSGTGVEVDFGRLLLLDASLCVAAFALSHVTRRHLAQAARVSLYSTGVVLLIACVGWLNSARREAEKERRSKEVLERNAERQRERTGAQRVLTDEEALRLLLEPQGAIPTQSPVGEHEWSPEDFDRIAFPDADSFEKAKQAAIDQRTH